MEEINRLALIQEKCPSIQNMVGEEETVWKDLLQIPGNLDHLTGQDDFRNLARIPNTTELFTCSYFPLSVPAEDLRIIIDNVIYDLQLIDDPMMIHDHLEIYLKNTGYRKEN